MVPPTGGPFRSPPSARELLERVAEVDVATRSRAVRITVARLALLVAVAVVALLVRRALGWVALGLAVLWVGSSQLLLLVVERRRRRASGAIARGDAVVTALHAGEPPGRGHANVELYLEAGTLYAVAPAELARAIADAGRRHGLAVTTTSAERSDAAPARRRAERIGEVAAQLAAVGDAAAPAARSFQAWREGFAHAGPLGPEALARIDAGLEALELAARAARLGDEHASQRSARVAAVLGGGDDPYGFLSEARERIAELERALTGTWTR